MAWATVLFKQKRSSTHPLPKTSTGGGNDATRRRLLLGRGGGVESPDADCHQSGGKNQQGNAKVVPVCQQHLRRELKPERHWVKEQKSPVEQTCRKLGMIQERACQTTRANVCVTSSTLRPLGDRRGRVWSPLRMAAPQRARQQYLEHPEQARREEPVEGAGAEPAD